MKALFIFLALICQLKAVATPSLLIQQKNCRIKGTVIDSSTKETIAFATVVIYDKNKKSIGGVISGEQGDFELENIPTGQYTVEVQFIGYNTYSADLVVKSGVPEIDLGTISITNIGQSLDEVTIKADKPLYVQKVDRTVINVQSSILSSGSTALEVLERSPGVLVNRQSNSISLVGKEGLMVMINGKISYMPQASIVQMLEGMSSDNIESIELITTPPANLDAEGNAGFINIVLKKQQDIGVNGSYSLSAGIGNGTTTQDNINFNYRKNKINLFGNYSFLRRNQKQIFKLGREATDEFGNIRDLSTTSYRDPVQRNHSLRFGMDYELTEKTILGVIIDAYDQKWTMDALSESYDTENDELLSFVELDVEERNQWSHIGGNFNFKHNFKEKEYLNMDIDYLYFYNENPTDYVNDFYDGQNNFLYQELTKSDKTTPLNTFVTNVDYSNQLTERIKLESGAKASFSSFENDIVVANFKGDDFVEDPTLTNRSDLGEKIFAIYSSVDYKLSEKTSAKVGLRFEQTDTKLTSDTEGIVVDRNYGELFPSVFLSHNVNDSLSFNVSYSRRISRPTFNDMAPFVIFFDPNTFFSGNPGVQPSISNGFNLGTNYKSVLLSAQYTIEDGTIARFQQQYDEVNDRLIYVSGNIDETKTFSLTLGLPVKITNWWKTQNTFIFINTQVQNTIEDVTYNYDQNTFNINSTQQFKFSETMTSEVNISYNGPSISGAIKAKSRFFMNFGIQKKFGEKWGTLRFNVNDIFDSLKFQATQDLPEENIKAWADIDFSNRTFVLTYTRNFGNSKLKSARQRETGAEEERNRVN
ncbi:TonB-dependent receptor domain-containing protein [Namhaeicola litoreus]|uniref:TonB-dependent receptor domain-containing protein n=1 Tax=Namhaeicola litoreus TaxID=1052145 RepID=A0ABW3XZL7_9FLAO